MRKDSRKVTNIKKIMKQNVKKNGKEVTLNTCKSMISVIPFVGEIVNEVVPSLYSLLKKNAFNNFVYGINQKLEKDNYTYKDYERFNKKLSNPQNFKYLANIIDSVFFSQSEKARVLLGNITASYINQNIIPYEDLIIISALKNLLDDDIDCFIKIYQSENFVNNVKTRKDNVFKISKNDYSDKEIISAEKLISLQIFSSEYSTTIGTNFLGVKTIISDKLYYYLKFIEE